MSYGNPYDPLNRNNLLSKAVADQKKVGGLGASNKPQYAVSPSLQPKGYDLKIDIPDNTKGTLLASKDATSLINNNNDESKTISGSLTQKEHSNPGESYKGKVWSEMSGAEKFQGGSAAALKILDTIDMLTGGQDKIIPGSGYAMSQGGYNPEMYIGQGMGY